VFVLVLLVMLVTSHRCRCTARSPQTKTRRSGVCSEHRSQRCMHNARWLCSRIRKQPSRHRLTRVVQTAFSACIVFDGTPCHFQWQGERRGLCGGAVAWSVRDNVLPRESADAEVAIQVLSITVKMKELNDTSNAVNQ
jgi:hypothetical protein